MPKGENGQGGCNNPNTNTEKTPIEVEEMEPNQVRVDIKRGYVKASGTVAIGIMPDVEKLSVDLIDTDKIYIGNETFGYFTKPREVNIEITENVVMCIFSAEKVLDYLLSAGIQDGTIYIKAYLKEDVSFDGGINYYSYVWGTDKIKTTVGRRTSGHNSHTVRTSSPLLKK